MDIRDYSDGYAEGQRIAEFFDERDVPDPQFEDHRSALYRKGWWDGFNNLEFDPGGQGLFHQPTDEEQRELDHEEGMRIDRELEHELDGE